MAKAAKQHEPGAPAPTPSAVSASPVKLPALLVSSDESLWTCVGVLGADWAPKQFDSVDELLRGTAPGQPGVVLWDARDSGAMAETLARIQAHSDRFVIVGIDGPAGADAWSAPMQQRQVVALASMPIDGLHLSATLQLARDELAARLALLGTGAAAPAEVPDVRRTNPWVVIGATLGAVALVGGAFMLLRSNGRPAAVHPSAEAPREPAAAGADVRAAVDSLIERAQAAMADRHYLEPADGSALSLYRVALVLDPANGEAKQGLARLSQVLFSRAQTALDDRKFDVALQALETARSITPDDPRLQALDGRVAALRNEIGVTQILAAINAQNFDRATQLIDEAARNKSLSPAKAVQLRDEVRREHDRFDAERLIGLVDARLQQERLIDPPNDSAAFYLDQARHSGLAASVVQQKSDEFTKRALRAARLAIEQRRFAEADRYLAELRNDGGPSVWGGLQRDLNAAQSQPAKERADPALLDLVRNRVAQGNLIEPADDGAVYYLDRLRSANPPDADVQQLTNTVQAALLEQARTALGGSDTVRADALLRAAGGLGPSAAVDALNERLLQAKLADSAKSAVAARPKAGDGVPDVVESTLSRLNSLRPTYPNAALQGGTEGWVELAYTVTPAGKVADVRVLAGSPPGIFDAAASAAVARLLYRPPQVAGRASAVTTKIRVAFRLADK